MCLIGNYLVIDEFTHKKEKKIFFLTHWHAGIGLLKIDHYGGLTNNWIYGPIYCSELTRRFLLLKYPKL